MSEEQMMVKGKELNYYLDNYKLENAAEYLMRVTEEYGTGNVMQYSSDDNFLSDIMCCCATDVCCESSCDCCSDCCCCDECGESSCGQWCGACCLCYMQCACIEFCCSCCQG